jgi:non-ribosomal peptide synthetase-like protein
MDSGKITEFDLVDVGDDAALNQGCTIQTHLFEDRVMKISNIQIGRRCSVGGMAVVLYDSRMEEGSALNDLSLLMKGEDLPADTFWEGIPARSVSRDGREPECVGALEIAPAGS